MVAQGGDGFLTLPTVAQQTATVALGLTLTLVFVGTSNCRWSGVPKAQ